MSYDLMVFDPKAPPVDREGFLLWYDTQTQWTENHDYNDPDITTPKLRSWFLEMVNQYPALNGPYASDQVDNPKAAEYVIGKSMIYVTFAWSQSESAYQAVFDMAKKHEIGFFDVSSTNGEVWMPDPSGVYACLHGGEASTKKLGKWWDFGKNRKRDHALGGLVIGLLGGALLGAFVFYLLRSLDLEFGMLLILFVALVSAGFGWFLGPVINDLRK
jgi:hypothetical protein